MKKWGIWCLALVLSVAFLLTACGDKKPTTETTADKKNYDNLVADIVIQDHGTITVLLDHDAAPITVENFVKLAEDGYYDGLTFHRIIDGFMMQGGDGGDERPAETIVGEFTSNGYENSIKHERGVISMARSNDPNSASSQFFIMHEAAEHLDGQYAAFGYVVSGIEIVDTICKNAKPIDWNGGIAASDQPIITTIKIREEKTPMTTQVTTTTTKQEPIVELPYETAFADIEIEGYGKITVQLEPKSAPITVDNFVKLAENGFYNGLTFHRIIEGFMMQGGDPEGTGAGGSDMNIVGEFASNGYDNPLKHTRGAVSMARTSDPNSASSQFFIVQQTSDWLDGEYAVFGYVINGMDVVDAVCTAATPIDGNGTIPADAQPVISSVTIRYPTTY